MADTSAEPEVHVRMFSQPRFLAAVRALVGTMAQRLGFSEMECGQISLAVDEALCNCITHGYDRKPDGQLWINLWALEGTPTGLKIMIEDLADQVDPKDIQPRDLDDIRPGGLGVHIIRKVMDEVTWERRSPEGMRLTMIKRLQTVGDADGADSRTSRQQRVEQ